MGLPFNKNPVAACTHGIFFHCNQRVISMLLFAVVLDLLKIGVHHIVIL